MKMLRAACAMPSPGARPSVILPFLIPLAIAVLPNAAAAQAQGPVPFRKLRLNSEFYSEGISYGDLNRDGHADIIAGPYWYPGPDFSRKLAFRAPNAAPFDTAGDSDCYGIFVYDFNQDGWPDILSFRQPGGAQAVWYENPKGADGYWPEHVANGFVNDESPAFADVDGDGKPELVTVSNGYAGLIKPDWANPAGGWPFHAVTPKGTWTVFTHGLGVGDVNGDGRLDLLLSEGWWEHPKDSAALWTLHPAHFWTQELPGETYGGAQMYAYDVNGDGRNDIVTSLQAHGWGLSWFEQNDTGFAEHRIMDNRAQQAQYGAAFAQLHALALADLDGDGLKDIVTGKRRGAHGVGLGGELDSPAVLYWFKLARTPGQTPRFTPYLIDSEAGVGTQVTVADVNGDGSPDILTAGRHGAFVFLNQKPSAGMVRGERGSARRRGPGMRVDRARDIPLPTGAAAEAAPWARGAAWDILGRSWDFPGNPAEPGPIRDRPGRP